MGKDNKPDNQARDKADAEPADPTYIDLNCNDEKNRTDLPTPVKVIVAVILKHIVVTAATAGARKRRASYLTRRAKPTAVGGCATSLVRGAWGLPPLIGIVLRLERLLAGPAAGRLRQTRDLLLGVRE